MGRQCAHDNDRARARDKDDRRERAHAKERERDRQRQIDRSLSRAGSQKMFWVLFFFFVSHFTIYVEDAFRTYVREFPYSIRRCHSGFRLRLR